MVPQLGGTPEARGGLRGGAEHDLVLPAAIDCPTPVCWTCTAAGIKLAGCHPATAYVLADPRLTSVVRITVKIKPTSWISVREAEGPFVFRVYCSITNCTQRVIRVYT